MSRLRLDSVEWKEFTVGDLFDIQIGKSIDGNKIQGNLGKTPYITRKVTDNGFDNFIDNYSKNFLYSDVPVITIGNETAKPFVQTTPFYTGTKVNILKPKEQLGKQKLLFFSMAHEKACDRYSYSFTANSTRLKKQIILLPSDEHGNPNWEFMEGYVKQEQKLQAQKIIDYYEQRIIECGFELLGFEDVEWKNFYVGDLFDFKQKPSKGLNHLTELDKGGVNYLGATNRNNGVISYVTSDAKLEYDGNCIAFIRNGEGSMGYSVYKKEKFIATQDISVGYNENLDKYIGLFITTIADKVRGKYNFGYKRNLQRLKKEVLRLPVDKDGKPHWEYMHKFMHKLENENILKVLEYI